MTAGSQPFLAVAPLISEGAAIVIATRDADLRPQLARGWGAALLADDGSLRLCIDAPSGSAVRAALTDGREIAVTFARPSTYRSVQVKGVVTNVGEPAAEHLAAVDVHVAAFTTDSGLLGVSPRLIPRMLDCDSLVSVTLTVDEVYDQTPGAAAGDRL